MPESGRPQVIITQVTQGELDEIAPLFDDYRMFYEQPSDQARAYNFLSQRITLNESVILLARRTARAVGFVQLFPSFSSVAMRRIWILNDLYVSPDDRHVGVATALLDSAYKHAVETGAVRLVLATAKGNEPARQLYAGNNWKEDEEFVHYQRNV